MAAAAPVAAAAGSAAADTKAPSSAAAAAASAPAVAAAKSAAAAAEPVLTGLKKQVDDALRELYALSETYTGDLKTRNTAMMLYVQRVVELCDAVEQAGPAKMASEGVTAARLWFWKGRAYDAFATYQQSAQVYLEKAVKKEPGMVEAWTALGNCFWKKKEFAKARDCLTSALQQDPKHKEALCALSMVLRNMPVAPGPDAAKQQAQNIKDSVSRAKEAIAVDGKDGKCWYVLGNALLTQFFMARASTDVLTACLKAYKQAEVSERNSAATNPDLHFNRAGVHKFYEDYQDAVDGFARAVQLDPSMTPAQEERDAVTRFVTKVAKLVSGRGGLKPKKLSQLVEPLLAEAKHQPTVSIDGSAKKRAGVNELKVGVPAAGGVANAGTILVTKVIAPISRDTDTPASFLVADASGTVCVVSLYNVTADVLGAVKTGATLAVLEPTVKQVGLTSLGGELTYRCVHTDPRNFIVNGRRINATAMAGATVRTVDPAAH